MIVMQDVAEIGLAQFCRFWYIATSGRRMVEPLIVDLGL